MEGSGCTCVGRWLLVLGVAGALCLVEFEVSAALWMLVGIVGVVGVVFDVVSFAFKVGSVSWFVMLLLARNWW